MVRGWESCDTSLMNHAHGTRCTGWSAFAHVPCAAAVPHVVPLQMSSYVLVTPGSSGSSGTDVALALLRMEPPSHSTALGFCVVPGLTPASKVSLVALLQLSVALGMALVIACVMCPMGECPGVPVGTLLWPCWARASP